MNSSLADARTQPGASKTVADVLTAAAEIVAKPGGWSQYYASVTETGGQLMTILPDAGCHCILGAVGAVAGIYDTYDVYRSVYGKAVETSLGGEHPVAFNDARGRTQAEVVAALREAAAKAAEAGQ